MPRASRDKAPYEAPHGNPYEHPHGDPYETPNRATQELLTRLPRRIPMWLMMMMLLMRLRTVLLMKLLLRGLPTEQQRETEEQRPPKTLFAVGRPGDLLLRWSIAKEQDSLRRESSFEGSRRC